MRPVQTLLWGPHWTGGLSLLLWEETGYPPRQTWGVRSGGELGGLPWSHWWEPAGSKGVEAIEAVVPFHRWAGGGGSSSGWQLEVAGSWGEGLSPQFSDLDGGRETLILRDTGVLGELLCGRQARLGTREKASREAKFSIRSTRS